MIILADESVDQQIVSVLRQDGHDVVFIAELSPSISDDEVLDEANQRGALLLTADKDFGELVFRQGRVPTGVVLIRLAGLGQSTKSKIVSDAFRSWGPQFVGMFSVVSTATVRIRQLP